MTVTSEVKGRASRIRARLWLALAILSLVLALAVSLFFGEGSSGVSITGAQIFLTIPMPIQDLTITESQINSVCVILLVLFLCLYLTEGLRLRPASKRQIVAEFLVEKVTGFVHNNMGRRYTDFAPFIAAIMAISACSSLLSLLGLYAPTSDINIVAGWAILVFILITRFKMKGGVLGYLKGLTEPTPILTPINIIGEFATPISMAFRHYGNVLSGTVISVMIYAALGGLSNMLLGWLPGFLGEIPFLQVGLPAVLSVYFDLFSGCLQAFIFAILTMLYIATSAPEEA